MENHFVCVSQPPVFQGHKTRPYSYVSSLTLLKAMHCAVAAGRACSFEDHFISLVKPSPVRDLRPSIP